MTGTIKTVTAHCLKPLHMNPLKGYTAEIADGTETGARATYNAHHFLHYRRGPCHWSHIRNAETSGTIYIMIDCAEHRDSTDQGMFLYFSFQASTTTGYNVEWRDSFGSGGYTTLWTTTSSSTGATVAHQGMITFTPPSSATNSMKVIEIHYEDLYPWSLSAYMIGDASIGTTQEIMDIEANGVGSILATGDQSIGGLMKAIGMGDDDLDSIERLTRRTFFNQSHPDGSFLDGATYTETYKNMFTEHRFRCVPRFLTSAATIYGKPAAVIMSHGHKTRNESVILRFEEEITGHHWEYTLQAGDDEDTPLFVNQFSGAGSSSSSGLELSGYDVYVEGWCTALSTLTLLSWGLFEGSAI